MTFGATYIVENVVKAAGAGAWLLATVAFSATLAQILLTLELARGLDDRARLRLLLLSGAAALAYAPTFLLFQRRELLPEVGMEATLGGAIGLAALNVQQATLVSLLAATALRAAGTPPEADRRRRALASLALAFGVYLTFLFCGPILGILVTERDVADAAFNASTLGTGILAIVAALPLLAVRSTPGLPRASHPILLAAGVVGLGVLLLEKHVVGDDIGSYGIVRTVGAAILAVGILKHDLLGVDLPHLALKRGTLAAGALATLFIVASVAQNFFSAEYGLVTGGVVAGAFLFAAQPMQRAMEKLQAPTPAQTMVEAGRAQESYRKAVRLALRDRRISREEEGHLHELARDLGIDGVRAHDIIVEVERELTAGR